MNLQDGAPSVQQLDNGLTVVCQESHRSKVVSLQVWVDVGSADEDESKGEIGLAHVHEHMLFKGTQRRGVGEIARSIESAGGEINAWTSFDNTVYYVSIASRYFATALDVLADAIQHSAFDAGELEREREVVLEEIKRSRDIPARVVSHMVFETAYQSHPYRRPVIGTEASVMALTRPQLMSFYHRHYRPERMPLIAVGGFDTQHVLPEIAAAFGSSLRGEGLAPQRVQESSQQQMRVRLAFGDTQETHLAFAWPIPPVHHVDVAALDVMSVLLGHGESSQLSRALRFRQRIVNEAYAYAYTPRDSGLLIVGSALHHERLYTAASAICQEIERLQEDLTAPRELDKAKTIIESEAIYQRETAQGMARKLGFFQAVLGDLGAEQEYYQAIRNVDVEDVRRVAQQYLSRQTLNCVAMAPRELENTLSSEALQEHLGAQQRRPHQRTLPAPSRSGAIRVELDSGMRVIVVPDRAVPVVSFRVVWLAGQRLETVANAGIGSLLSRLLTKGTASRSALEIAHAVDAMAASLDGFSGRNTAGFHADFLARFAEQGLDLIADCALRPAFRDEDIDREREQILELIRAREDDLSGLAFRLFASALYPAHPYRLDPLGTRDSVLGIGEADLHMFHQNYLGCERAVVVVGGDIDTQRAIDLVEAALKPRVELSQIGVTAPTADVPPQASRVVRLARERAQAHIVYGFAGTTFVDPDRFALEVLSTTLAGQSGRLFLELRDRQSLAYSVTAVSVEGLEPGYFGVYIGTSPEKVDAALAGVQLELERLCREPPSDDEIDRTKRLLIGSHEIGLQRVGARASVMAFNELYNIGHEAHLDYADRIDAVTRDDLLRVAQRTLRLDRSVLAIVGPDGCGGPVANVDVAADVDL